MRAPTSFLNALITSRDMVGSWTAIKDIKGGLYYMGWIDLVSDSGRERDLLLRDVRVHNVSGECVDKADVVYLSRKQDELSVEALVLFDELTWYAKPATENER